MSEEKFPDDAIEDLRKMMKLFLPAFEDAAVKIGCPLEKLLLIRLYKDVWQIQDILENKARIENQLTEALAKAVTKNVDHDIPASTKEDIN